MTKRNGGPVQTATRIDWPREQVFEFFRSKGNRLGLPLTEDHGCLTLETPSGTIVLSSEKSGVRIALSAADPATLHTLLETVDRHLDSLGSAHRMVWSHADPGALPANMTFATIRSCSRISPSYFRLRVADPSLQRFARGGLHFRLLFAPPGHQGEWPEIGEDGRTHWPGDRSAWHRPVYTVREIDVKRGELDFDVFVHAGGRVSEWCETAQPGEQIALMGPGGEWYPRAAWLGLFGDETALPAIARILAALPSETLGMATVMVGNEDDTQTLTKPIGVELRWLLRSEGHSILEAIERTDLPLSDRFVWFAGERSEVALARRALSQRGLDKSEIRAAAYWAADEVAS
ncbi:siderophore-interacting protein [Notoacmeibacter sp. MSK16QG-6]|uniref:siderophore-interacting protein n=1 Tax=Notoacmeibacter sp. MSK16QG-6 TaxID=2957982 RepID=UPI00209EF5BC|nr:siderophore-interacting protein [Notoacmeibacter sp. MSK16QG-6]MCP1198307.1 siderophore-interacting protein [Notoacmeibacter sp. MSK16QG-6]